MAAGAGVSKGTASLALSGADGPSAATRARVADVAARLGYRANRPATLLARRRTHLLGVVMQVRSGYHAELVDHVQAAAEVAGYEMVLSPVTRTHDEERAVTTLLDGRCEALLLLGPELAVRRLEELAARRPVVAVGRRTSARAVDVVRSADDDGVALVVEHLAALGHRELALVGGGSGAIARDRRRGFERAGARTGTRGRLVAGGTTEEAGAAAVRSLLRTPGRADLPTALLAQTDLVALGVLDALADVGLAVPGDVSVTGYDDSPLARLRRVDLTSVDQGAQAQAVAAVTAAVERLDGGRTTRAEVVLGPRLVVRGSSGPPRSAAAGRPRGD
ncbi:LacI family DNA-binding transcriptional regulator [Pseudokineococcus basanitobsidens]|uniref:LacI family DNA-binding transcriptional regulator n=1 Tax=Pseudokineococcus basanitobsidens TaxID=1926649 RepID=A0ABU8RFU8_9ACTN